MGYGGGGVNGTLRWRDLALDLLLPINEEKEQMKRAEKARKMASGTASNQPPAQAHQQPVVAQDPSLLDIDDEGEEEEDDEDDEEDEEDTEEEEEEDADGSFPA
jgi:hypothetical protein